MCIRDSKKTGVYTSRQGFTYRLAFTYLDYAEANNEAYDTSAARELCLKYLNKVRERAGVRQYTFDAVSDLDENFIHIAVSYTHLDVYKRQTLLIIVM